MKILENLSGVTELRSETLDKFETVKDQLKKLNDTKLDHEWLKKQVKELADMLAKQLDKLEKLEEQIRKIGYVNDELGVLEKMINDAKEEETN